MSDFLSEKVPRMPAMSVAMIEEAGEKLLDLFFPEALKAPTPIDCLALIDTKLQGYGILVYPAHDVELGDRLAATDPAGDREITILMSSDLWDDLLIGGKQANRARATLMHELGHAILHVPVVRSRLKSPLGNLLMNRVSREELKAYVDPEWQAWTLAGCVLAPRKTIQMANTHDVRELADIYQVSEGMMRSHLKRLKLLKK